MTAPQRFDAWRAIVIGTLALNIAYAATGLVLTAVVSTFLLLAMISLLATTPADAIVLPRARSERIIAVGFAVAAAIATRAEVASIAIASGLFIFGVALLAMCRWRTISAWWTAVALWQPILLTLIRSGSV